jgi:hypothetical protein
MHGSVSKNKEGDRIDEEELSLFIYQVKETHEINLRIARNGKTQARP